MKIWKESVAVSGKELNDIARYPLSDEFDRYLSGIMSYEIEQNRADIGMWLKRMTEDWNATGGIPGEWAPDDNLPREKKNFNAFVRRGKHLKAGEAALILRYIDSDTADKRDDDMYRMPRDFAEEFAVVSLLQAAQQTKNADTIPVNDLLIYRECQRLETSQDVRRAWGAATQTGSGYSKADWDAYFLEFCRKAREEAAGKSLANAHDLSVAYDFSLSEVARNSLG